MPTRWSVAPRGYAARTRRDKAGTSDVLKRGLLAARSRGPTRGGAIRSRMRAGKKRSAGKRRPRRPRRHKTDLIPLLSCRERQVVGVHEGAERSEAGLDRLEVRERDQMEPGQEQARADV